MGLCEETFVYSSLNQCVNKIVLWVGYINDIPLIWSGSQQELLQFRAYLNNTNLEFSLTNIHFRDLEISKDNRGEPIDCNIIPRAESYYPPWLIEHISFTPFVWMKHICDSE